MKKLITILFVFPLFLKAQILTDSVIIPNTTIRYATTYTSVDYISGDSVFFRSSLNKKRGLVSPLSLPISTLTQTALDAKQTLNAKLTSISGLANASGFLKNNGSGVFSYDNPAGAGTVTDVSVVSANGVSGSVASSTSTPAITLILGAITPTTVNGITVTNLLLNTTTSGVAASPTASGTTTITHGLGRTPTIIRIYGLGTFTSSTSATPTPFSIGTFNSTGNRCIYMTSNGTTTQASQTSTAFAVFIATSAGNTISGVIQNVTSTTFDISWTEIGTATAQNFLWESQ